MTIQRMVLRLKNKSLLKGTTRNFSPTKPSFHLTLLSGKLVTVDLANLKAAFFVKNFNGDRDYKYTYRDYIPWGGNKVKIKFVDGEVMVGYTSHYPYGDQGFFIKPADLQGNNERVYVVASSAENITFL